MSRRMSEDLKNPYLFEEHDEGQYIYMQDENLGKSATGSLKLADEVVRDSKQQMAAGGAARRGKEHEWGPDDGGHLIGARFAGSVGKENLTAQDRNVNRGEYKSLENKWASHLNVGDKVFVNVEASGDERPDAYMGYAIYETPEGVRDLDAFHIMNESQSTRGSIENDALQFEFEMGDTLERHYTEEFDFEGTTVEGEYQGVSNQNAVNNMDIG